ncbi:MAG: starch-binding protein [Erysipelotrichaceae bacterium]|nr:starch-binding protein [Erysipelotrichaceae bacterium]
MKKKTLSSISLLLLFSLAACGTASTDPTSKGEGGGGGADPSGSSQSGGGNTQYSYIDYDEDGREWISNGPQQAVEPFTPVQFSPISNVQVFCPTTFTNIYAWTTTGGTNTELLGAWPGTALKEYNSRWKMFDFPAGSTSFNLIFNTPGKTGDLTLDGAGHYWLVNGQLTKTDTEPEQSSGSGSTDWNPKATNIYKDSKDYKQPERILKPTHNKVNSAKDYSELPVVKNWNKTSVINKYNGKRDDFRDESIYFTITTRFYDGDKSNNTHCWDAKQDASTDPNWRGDFKGLIEKMDYIKAQGFTAIWITPIVKNASGFDYHGYHAINFKEVDPRYESEDVSFQTVINEAHKRDMKIILDIVLNHTGNFGEENLFPMFYYDVKNNTTMKAMTRNRTDYGKLPDSYDTSSNPYGMRIDAMKNDEGDTENIYHHEKSMAYEQYIEQTGQMAGDCVDLNTENPTVANYLVEAYAKFIHMGVDAFRIDTVKHISRLSFNKYYLPAFKAIAAKCGNPNFFMFGEVCTRVREVWNHDNPADSAPFYTWKESKDYPWGTRAVNEESTLKNWNDNSSSATQPTTSNAYLNGTTYHAPDHSKSSGMGVIDFPMHWNFESAQNAYNVAVGNDKYYNDATYNVVYVDSHDDGPDGIYKVRFNMGESAWKENMSLMFTFRGIPCIYYGSEIQFQAGKTIDEGPNIALADSGRAYFGEEIEGNVKVSDFGKYSNASGKMASALNGTLSKHLQKLNQARLSCIALRRGQYTNSNFNGNGIGFTRRYTANGVDSIACVVISGSGSFNNLPNGTYKDLYSGSTYQVNGGTLQANASGQGNVAIFVKQ